MRMTRNRLGIAAILVPIFIAGCSPALASPQATHNLPPSDTIAPPTPSPTIARATEPPPSATSTNAPVVEPTATFSPEIIAAKPEDIAGVWLLKTFVGQGGMVRFPADLTFRQDATFSFDEKDEPMHIFGGTIRFAGGKVTLDSDECYNEAKGLFYRCTITFTIYSRSQAGKPVRIRLVSAGDKGVFVTNVNGKELGLDEP